MPTPKVFFTVVVSDDKIQLFHVEDMARQRTEWADWKAFMAYMKSIPNPRVVVPKFRVRKV